MRRVVKLPDARVILPALSLNNTQQKIVEAIAEYSQELLQKNANDPRVIPYALLVAQLLVEQTKMKLYVHYIFAPLVYRRISWMKSSIRKGSPKRHTLTKLLTLLPRLLRAVSRFSQPLYRVRTLLTVGSSTVSTVRS